MTQNLLIKAVEMQNILNLRPLKWSPRRVRSHSTEVVEVKAAVEASILEVKATVEVEAVVEVEVKATEVEAKVAVKVNQSSM